MSQLLQNAIYGTALILVAAILRRVLKGRLLPEARLALWAVCLFRLLTPAAPESVLSLWGLLPRAGRPAGAAPMPDPAPVPSMAAGGVPAVAAPAAGTVMPAEPAGAAFPWGAALLAVWIGVGAVLAVRYVLSWRRTRRAVACAIPLGRDDPRYAPLPKCACLREGFVEGAPLTFGAVRPTVVLSPGLAGEELVCVLAHEGVHARRRDNLWHYAMALAQAVYWWDPAVWLMARLLRRDIELSCDRAAVKALGADKRAEYAQALLSMATQAEGPAFCQTFGRKAAEERIVSIMKYKKTTIAGAVLSLALVIGVTVAFASAPKTIDDTVEFGGRAYSRADLSAETLEWLDWYLALPEEEQLAVSYVPHDLLPEEAPETSDALAMGEDLPSYVESGQAAGEDGGPAAGSVSVCIDGSVVTRVIIPLDYLEEVDLANEVSSKAMTQDEADRILAQARIIAKDGVIDWTFPAGSALRHEDLGDGVSANGYWNEAGEFVCVSFSEIVGSFILPQAMEEDLPSYVEPGQAVGELGSEIYDYHFESADGVATGVVVEIETTPQTVSSGGPQMMELDEYKALLDELVSGGKMARKDADNLYAAAEERLEQRKSSGGGSPRLMVSVDGSCAVYTWWQPCTLEDCDVSGLHWHEDGEVVHYYDASPAKLPECLADGCTLQGVHTHDGVTYRGVVCGLPTAPTTDCHLEGCTETRYHAHNEGRTILLSDPCPVEGCTITGNHIHGEVCYSCNGAGHSGGVCDWSCYHYAGDDDGAASPAVPSAAPVSSGHHSESHHSDHH